MIWNLGVFNCFFLGLFPRSTPWLLRINLIIILYLQNKLIIVIQNILILFMRYKLISAVR